MLEPFHQLRFLESCIFDKDQELSFVIQCFLGWVLRDEVNLGGTGSVYVVSK